MKATINDFRKLVELLNLFKIEYQYLKTNEIVLPLPCDELDSPWLLFQKEIINNPNTTVLDAEAILHIEFDENEGFLNFLVVIGENYKNI